VCQIGKSYAKEDTPWENDSKRKVYGVNWSELTHKRVYREKWVKRLQAHGHNKWETVLFTVCGNHKGWTHWRWGTRTQDVW